MFLFSFVGILKKIYNGDLMDWESFGNGFRSRCFLLFVVSKFVPTLNANSTPYRMKQKQRRK